MASLFFLVITFLIFPDHAWGAFATQFSLAVGEAYSDNIFFTKDKEADFITIIVPTFSLLYAPEGQVAPTLSLNFTPNGQIFARHSELNSFGDNFLFNGAYTYQYSPRLNLSLSNNLQRFGQTRTVGLGNNGFLQLPGPVASPSPAPTLSRSLSDFLTGGDLLTNFFLLRGSYLYRPDISFVGEYSNTYTNFIDQGGSDLSNNISFRGVYNWRGDHNLHAGYSISIIRSRDGDSNTIQSFDIGDDYFTQYKLQLTPTLSLAASAGLSLNAGNDGPRVAPKTNVTVTKLWETATLSGGVFKGLTPSYGVAGISDTTTVFTNFVMRFTEKLSVNAAVNFDLFNTDEVNFKTFQGIVGLQYSITPWLASALNYNFRWIDSGSGASNTDLLTQGIVKANTVFATLTASFDLWPNIRLAPGINSSTLIPALRTPFPSAHSSFSPVPVTTP